MAPTSAGSPVASRRSRTRTWRWWPNEVAPLRRRQLGAPVQDDHALAVRRDRERDLPALLRDGRVLRLPRRPQPEDARLRLVRGGGDGHVVVREHLRGLGDAAGALVGDARAARRRAAALRARPVAGDARARDSRDLQPGRDAPLGPVPVRRPPVGRAPAPLRPRDPRHRPRVRRPRLPVRCVVRPLAGRLGARELLRVPGLADLRLPRPAGAPSRLGAPASVGARADLGDERDPRVGARRLVARRSGRLPRARPRLRRARRPGHGPRPARRPAAGLALADVIVAARIFFVGGVTSFRALFYWLTPWIYIPTMFVSPIFQILLFAYIGRSAHLRSDEFYLIGNALQYASIPCLFAMAQSIGGERYQQTLGAILVSPAPRIPLFFGRSLPVVLNGAFVSAFSLAAGSLILGVHLPASSLAPLALVVLIASFSCTGLGLVNAALSLRIRENAVLSNAIFGFLLIFTGANVPLDALPGWMSTAAQGMPFTHAIAAARKLADGAGLGDVSGLLGAELLVGAIYGLAGFLLLRWFETLSRRYASLERS